MKFVNSRFINVLYRCFWYTKLYLYNRIFIRNIQTKGLCWWIYCSLFNLHVLLFLWMSACHHAQRNCLPYQCVGHDSNSPFQTICIFITNNYIFYFWKKKKSWVFFLKVNWILQHDAYLQLQTWATIFMVSFNQWSFKSMRIKCLLLKRGTEEEVIFKQLKNRW